MNASIITISALLKLHYIDPIVDQINQESMLLDNFEKAPVPWAGQKAVFALHTQRNSSVSAASDGQTLGTPGSQTWEQLQVPSAYVYGQFGVTGPALASAANGGDAAFISLLEGEMEPLKDDVRHYTDICMFTGGPAIGYVWEKNAALTTLQASVRTSYPTSTPGYNPIGAAVKVYRTDTFAEVDANAGRQISAIATDGTSITVSIAINTSTVPSSVLLLVASSATGLLNEPNGLAYNMFSPTWYNLTRGQPQTASLNGNYVLANGTTASFDDLTANNLQKLDSAIMFQSGMRADAVFCSPLQVVSYSSILQGTASGVATAARLDVKTGAAKGDIGFSGFSWAGMPLVQAQDCPIGVYYMLTRKFWKLAVLKAGAFDETTGAVLRAPAQQDNYTGMFKWYYNLVSTRPNASGVIAGIALPNS